MLLKEKYKKELKKITNKIVKGYDPEKIYLFGSVAWGKPHKDSDIDLFIVKNTRKKSLNREREIRHMLFGYDFPAMDLLVYTPKELKERISIDDPFVKEVVSKGKLLYDK